MEIRIYDAAMNFRGLIEDQTSFLWTRRYFEPGCFEIHCPITANNLRMLQRGRLVWHRGAAEAGVIESIVLEQDEFKSTITAKGRFLESYMSRRLIRPTYNANNQKVEVVMRELLSNAVPLPLVQLGALQGYTDRVTFQATYKNLLTYETKLAKYAGYGFRFRPDFTAKTITFGVYKGLDRSVSQTDRSRVFFALEYNNIAKAKYQENDQLLKTVCYVGGEGEGSERVYAVAGDDTTTGLERSEMFLSASDVRSDGLTPEQYTAALIQRGNNALDNNALSKSFECSTYSAGNFTYKTHYDLGDIVTVRQEQWGLQANLRLVEITEVYESDVPTVQPVFGSPLPSVIDWSDINNG